MALSIGFSFILYRISSNELNRELRLPGQHEVWQPDDIFNFDQFRDLRISTGRANLQQGLIIFNIGALVLGSLASYVLAKRTLKPIEEAMESQSRFTADASHELRTPLTAMQTEIEVALRNKKIDKNEAIALLQSNLEEVAKLKDLSDGLLRLARQEELKLQPIAVRKVIDTAIDQVDALAKARNIKITNQASSVRVISESQSLKDALVILLDNAIKYSNFGQSIEITTKRTDGHVLIAVQDYGVGIGASDLPHIFERFYRADQSRSKNQVDGHGLGLAIVKQIINSQNGNVSVTSQPNKGSIFTINLAAAHKK